MEFKRKAPADLIIHAGRLIDGRGGEPKLDQALVVRDGRIRCIRPWDDQHPGSLDGSAVMVDLSEATLLPGLIDAHVHLPMNADKFSYQAAREENPKRESDEMLLLRAVGNAQAALNAGVTTLCDCGSPNQLIFALRNAIQTGSVLGPRLLVSGHPLSTADGHGGLAGRPVKGVSDIRKAVREQVEAGADFIKIMVTGGGGRNPESSQFTLTELKAAVAEAQKLGKRVVVHCHGVQGIRDAAAAGVTRIEHCTFMQDGEPQFHPEVAAEIVRRGIYVCSTNVVDYRQMQLLGDSDKVKELAPRSQLNVTWRKLLQARVRFVAGSDAGISQVYCDDYALIMELMVGELGMTPMQAIMAGTSVAAEALGMEAEIGALEAGKRADMVALNVNPLEEIGAFRDIRMVLLDGRIVRGPWLQNRV